MAMQNGHARATEVLREAMKRMEALNIDPSTAFESSVTYLTEWMLQVEGGDQVLLTVAAHMQRCAIEQEVLARITPGHSVN